MSKACWGSRAQVCSLNRRLGFVQAMLAQTVTKDINIHALDKMGINPAALEQLLFEFFAFVLSQIYSMAPWQRLLPEPTL